MSVSEPSKILTPWATSGLKNTIPSAADPVTGKAGYDQGFPAINMTAKEAGGIPPFGQDFNGIFFDITQILQYMQAGGHPTYSSALSTAIGGYPFGAMLAKASGFGFWRNITANNTTNPDSGGAGWVSDSPGSYTNASTVTASSTTLTSAQVGQAFLFTTAASTVALPAASGVSAGGTYKLHTSAGFTLSVTGGGAMQAGNASVTSLSVPAGTEALAVSTGTAWWVFGTGVQPDVYRRSNIVGTVSQAAGVPTGAIIEYGINANGDYTKFADGSLICSRQTGALDPSESAGRRVVFPHAFIKPPATSCSVTSNTPVMAVFSVADATGVSGVMAYSISGARVANNVYLISCGKWI